MYGAAMHAEETVSVCVKELGDCVGYQKDRKVMNVPESRDRNYIQRIYRAEKES